MYYVGKLFSNVKVLYNEINPATLTGAIDVIVVRQKDGTYTTSPWHVRFGKMSVIRTREKVEFIERCLQDFSNEQKVVLTYFKSVVNEVDIEINGEPACMHMKLGEAGEAFFVQETDDACELPAYLATSPIGPTLSEMEAGLAALKAVSSGMDDTQDDPMTPVNKHCGTVITVQEGKMVASGIPPNMASDDDRQYFSDSDVTTSSSRRRRHKESVATQTCVSLAVECVASNRPSTPQGEWYADLLTDVQHTTNSFTKQQEFVMASSLTTSCAAPFSSAMELENELPMVTRDVDAVTMDVTRLEDTQFDMDLSDDERTLVKSSDLLSHLNTVGRCISMPTMHHSDDYDNVDTWASKQYATTAMSGFIDLSSSPVNYRSGSPASDTEVMNANRDATCQTLLTGSRLTLLDDVKWRWGEFPESTSLHHFSVTPSVESSELVTRQSSNGLHEIPVLESSLQNSSETIVEEPLTAELSEKEDVETPTNAVNLNAMLEQVSEASSSDLATSPDSKKESTKKQYNILPNKEIYLDDLTHDEPELAELYLYNRKSNTPQCLPVSKDEDSESGRGASLPQSPLTVETESRDNSDVHGRKKLTSESRETSDVQCQKNTSSMLPALSLCGPLEHEDTVISDERFNQYLITYDVLMDNPNVLCDPNLVARIDGRLFNWAIAAPMIISNVVFNKPLSEACLTRLLNQHLPKKESSSRRSWRFWRRGETGVSTNTMSSSIARVSEKESGESAPSSQQASPSDTPQKSKPNSKSSSNNAEAILSSDEENEVLALPVTSVTSEDVKPKVVESTTGYSMSREKCRKSLKLSSDEIARLNLKDGVNEVTFSVTTQYQGTTKCQCFVYLWQWDDRIIVSDIDGTITKSDVLGQVLPMIGSVLPYISTDWSQAGIAQLYQMISRNGYKFLYLSARAIGQSKLTRDYLRGVRQCDISLPDGPLLLSPSSLMSAFHKEVIERKPEQFKISCLRDISALFPPTENPFIAGFGNKINDVWAYREVGIPLSRIFTVNHKGELRMDSTQAFLSSYKKLSDIVDHLFPPRNACMLDLSTASSDYNSFSYWRNPVALLDTSLVTEFVRARDAVPSSVSEKMVIDAKKSAKRPLSAASSAPSAENPKLSVKADSKTGAK